MQRDELRKEPGAGRRHALGVAVLCFLVALAAPGSIFELSDLHWLPPSEWPGWFLRLHWVIALLVVAPFAIIAIDNAA